MIRGAAAPADATATSSTTATSTARAAATTATSKKKGRPANKSATKSSTTTKPNYMGTTPTSIQTAWEQADAAADDYFARHKGAAELEALYEVAANARVHARAELKLNENERWWWRDIIPSAASAGGKKKADEGSLECHESYDTLQVEKDVEKHQRREAIIRVSQETLILRYAATVLRQKAREWAARRVKAGKQSKSR